MASSGAPEQSCPGCGAVVSTAGLEPFSKVGCPACGLQLRVERTFENYQVVEPLGSGGMGSVFKARDLRLNRFVALKLLRREFADDASFTEKLREEARITAAIRHPHVVEVYAVGEDHSQFYVVMELVDGGSLDDRMEDEKRIGEGETLEIGIQVAEGLRAALKAGLIHRDIKPGNILFADRQTAKIVDFGLAALAEEHAPNNGEIWGTPYYVAPERLANEPEDFRSDLYSLGATLFHAIAGRATFEEETSSANELRKLKSRPVSLRAVAPEVSEETAAAIEKMLRPDPAERQASYKQLIAELQAARAVLLAREEELRRRWSWPLRALISLGALVLLAALIYGVNFGLRHLPRRATSTVEATPAPSATLRRAEINDARRALAVGHYGEAQALFQQLAARDPRLQPLVELCGGLQLWEEDGFAAAATAFRHFLAAKIPPEFVWAREFRPRAQDRLHDYQLYNNWETERSALLPNEPEKALPRLRQVIAQLKTKSALVFRLNDEESALVAQVATATKTRAAAEKKVVAAEEPRWQAALRTAQQEESGYRFDEAVAALQNVQLTAAPLLAQREEALHRARWLAEWKGKLIADLNSTGYGGAINDIHGLRYDAGARRATADEIELKTRYGAVMTRWTNLSPQMLLAMSRAFIRPRARDLGEREWLSAIFAKATGQDAAARDLATKAAAASGTYRELLPQFFPAAK